MSVLKDNNSLIDFIETVLLLCIGCIIFVGATYVFQLEDRVDVLENQLIELRQSFNYHIDSCVVEIDRD